MPFDFNNYEAFGRNLKDGPDEVHYRNSVSRGYYSLFHKVKIFLGYSDRDYKNHIDLINELKSNNTLQKGAKLSHALKILKKDREAADYYNVPKYDVINFQNNVYSNDFWLRYDNFIKLLEEERLRNNSSN